MSRFAASQLGPQQRADALARLRTETFDVVVIGGGVTGAGAALDAASRGLSVALVEARDFASGTSSRSSKLIHGGLRYLEQLNFSLVREALEERGRLLTTLAPHLVRPTPFLLPLNHHGWQRLYYGAGVALYDTLGSILGTARGVPRHRHLSRAGARRLFPSLRRDALVGAIRYYDGHVDDARFVLALARTAASYGAVTATSTRVVDLLRNAREVVGVRVRDLESDDEFEIRARTVVAATGVWSDDLSEMLHERPGLRVRASKGVHLVVPRSVISGDVGLILRTEKSVLFVIPWGGHWIIGTTDTDWDLDRAHPAASSVDIDYILEHVNAVLERPITHDDIEGVYAGLRPLLAGEDESSSKLSREHAVVEPMLGLMLVAGGKYTTYRVMAADVIDKAAHRLRDVPRSRTQDIPLIGADGFTAMWANRADLARRHGVTVGAVEHLLERYGSLTTELLASIDADPRLGQPVAGAPEYLAAEIAYAASHEGALHLEDVLTRRTRISIETAHRGLDSVEDVADVLAPALGWDAATRRREVEHYRARVLAERESQRMPDDLTADAARLGAPDVRKPSARP
ncbi:glycerol-3-phosphate dehydrogenase/oxidase, partial [Cryptosporangium arvum]|uniref:Glycerol-3-phosphate dehydrogenase n=1 Tax=Cryptosporangium arvum DSM 44712 TaxID=927661 RepID=A0A010YGU6_9ACTN|nr:glycerol-3-phosphate dehydrogenase [Cryptosporangium arvum DSM 44712]